MPIKIFIDQGHNPPGYFNAGATGMGLEEGNVNYMVGTYLANILKNDSRFDVWTSRTCITQVVGFSNTSSLEQRVYEANWWEADYFLSIHCNSSTNSAANGSEIYVYKKPSVAYNLSEFILADIVGMLGTTDRGVKVDPSYYVLKKTKMPACLIELAFITNSGDAIKLKEQQYTFAVAIYQGLLDYFFG